MGAAPPDTSGHPAPTEMPPAPDRSSEILCVGEVLWDALPDGLFLGGAPFNVAAHLFALGQKSTLVSRVGADVLGEEVRRRMHERGMETDLVQVDPAHDTGLVRVRLDPEGQAQYDIVGPVAWDAIAWTDTLAERVPKARAVVVGSLAQRSETSRHTIRTLCDTAEGLVVYDVNLRPPHTDRSIVEPSLQHATVLKCNVDELEQMRSWFDLPAGSRRGVEALASRFGLRACCVTRGGGGATLWMEHAWYTHPGFDVTVRDTVGAGDAFLAALLTGLLVEGSPDTILDGANRLGAFVASRAGATPSYEFEGLDAIEQLPLDPPEHPQDS